MKLDKLIFALVLGLGAVVVATALWGTDSGPGGHPRYSTMTHGGSANARYDDTTLLLGWSFGAVTILLFVALMAFGARRRGGRKGREALRGLGRYLIGGTAAYLAVWTALMLAYRSYRDSVEHPLFLAFPAPTALMLYVLVPVPLLFVLCFVLGFRRWVLTEEEQAAYERLLEEAPRPEGEP